MNEKYQTTTLGYPRLGKDRAYKKLLENFWSEKISENQFVKELKNLEIRQLEQQKKAGIDLICCGDFSPYDHVLDMAVTLGCIPERFGYTEYFPSLSQYYTLARGVEGIAPLEMTKWFNTNYHYLVPDFSAPFKLFRNPIVNSWRRGKEAGIENIKPYLLGPFTLLRLAKLHDTDLFSRIEELTYEYLRMLNFMRGQNIPMIQIDEPSLVTDVSKKEWEAVKWCYTVLAHSGLPLCIQTYYDDVAHIWDKLICLPVDAIGVDLVAGEKRNLSAIFSIPFPKDKKLVAGIVDGRNVWRSDLSRKLQIIKLLSKHISADRLLIAPSCSLLHLPETVESEDGLPPELKSSLCFAEERLQELTLLGQAMRGGIKSVNKEWKQAEEKRKKWMQWEERNYPVVQNFISQLTDQDFRRANRTLREYYQKKSLNLPILPTTTIGSFPQTLELRIARANRAKNPADYAKIIQSAVEQVIHLQEEIGLDVLVDGEPDRSDMVEFFAEKLKGCAVLKQGWVQSYGNLCVRPPVIYGDVWRDKPLTTEVSRYAKSLTKKPVKGMLTGPITILCWSFVRDDLPREQVAYQIALAIRKEIMELESEVGLQIIQIDEPAFREGLPLKKHDQVEYLNWAIRAFKLASSGVSPNIQIHTHMCYAEFKDCFPAIAALDADVISFEDARSNGDMIEVLGHIPYQGNVGPGVWDIHSPQAPSVDFIVNKLKKTLKYLRKDQVWVNPDCGLKTRRYEEVIPSLKNMVEAARKIRNEV